MLKPFTVWFTTNCGKFLKRWEYQTTFPVSWETCMQVRKQQLEQGMEQQTGSKLGKEFIQAVYCHPAYLTYMQCPSCKMLDWMNHKLESRFPGEISTTSVRGITKSWTWLSDWNNTTNPYLNPNLHPYLDPCHNPLTKHLIPNIFSLQPNTWSLKPSH